MFTGIVEEMGVVHSVTMGVRSAVLDVEAHTVLDGTKIGDSIAVNGVCLTVTGMQGSRFQADVMAETLRRSSLGELHRGSRVNLERAMPADGRFGGHIVSGHIDGTGRILSMVREDNAVWVEIGADRRLLRYIIEKGSVAVDGISLTVAGVTEKSFRLSVIPHTGAETTLLHKRAGDVVNLENDLVGKYIERFLAVPPCDDAPGQAQPGGITEEMLVKYGF